MLVGLFCVLVGTRAFVSPGPSNHFIDIKKIVSTAK